MKKKKRRPALRHCESQSARRARYRDNPCKRPGEELTVDRRVQLALPEGAEPKRILFFFQAEDGIRDVAVIGVQTCALPISPSCGTSTSSSGASCSAATPPSATW